MYRHLPGKDCEKRQQHLGRRPQSLGPGDGLHGTPEVYPGLAMPKKLVLWYFKGGCEQPRVYLSQ